MSPASDSQSLHLLHLARLPHLDDAPWLNLEADNPVTLIGVTCTSSKQWQDLGAATVRKPEARMVLEIQLQVVVEVVPERVHILMANACLSCAPQTCLLGLECHGSCK